MAKKDRIEIKIHDIGIFKRNIEALNRFVNGIKMDIDKNGLTIMCRNTYARFHILSNCVTSEQECNISIKDLMVLIKTLKLVEEQCSNIESLTCYYEDPFIHFKSKDVRTKLGTIKEKAIQQSIDSEFSTELTPVLEFRTTSKTIKDVCKNRFIFTDVEFARVYLIWGEKDMHNNTMYAEINNRMNELNSSLTLQIGDITLNKLTEDPNIIIDFDRLSSFNLFQCDEVLISYMDKGCLVSETSINNDGDIFSKMKVYNSLRAS